ncbi:hypothetical protein [Streptomyces sp. STR69]|uniref:hypothetical protein n=1 Tax=Streptomyces sp. STR69 TaxID=1796942 RepID=UPI0021C756B1|nr:hypothetical protein [Streptomyces sp. STR69]
MLSSIPHPTPGPRGLEEAQEDRARVQRDDLLDLLRVIRDALDVPSGASHQGLRDARTRMVHNTVHNVLTGALLGVAWETEQLCQEIADESPRVAFGETRVVMGQGPAGLWSRFAPASEGHHA